MFPITDRRIEDYLFGLAERYDEPVLLAMERLAEKNHFPIVDRLVGVFLKILAETAGARMVFELGSGFGYSAYWFATAVGPSGKVICTEGQEKNKKLANEFLAEAGLWGRIDFQLGDAVKTLKNSAGPFDIIFNDIDKHGYPDAWEVAKTKLRPGGLYIADNTLWFGRVVEKKITDDVAPGWTEAILEHNNRIFADKNFDATIIPLRDGVLIARKRG